MTKKTYLSFAIVVMPLVAKLMPVLYPNTDWLTRLGSDLFFFVGVGMLIGSIFLDIVAEKAPTSSEEAPTSSEDIIPTSDPEHNDDYDMLHSIYFDVILTAILYFIARWGVGWLFPGWTDWNGSNGWGQQVVIPIVVGLFFGYLSRLVLEMLTPTGVAIFYPFSHKRYHIAKINSEGEYIILILLWILIIKLEGPFFHSLLFEPSANFNKYYYFLFLRH